MQSDQINIILFFTVIVVVGIYISKINKCDKEENFGIGSQKLNRPAPTRLLKRISSLDTPMNIVSPTKSKKGWDSSFSKNDKIKYKTYQTMWGSYPVMYNTTWPPELYDDYPYQTYVLVPDCYYVNKHEKCGVERPNKIGVDTQNNGVINAWKCCK